MRLLLSFLVVATAASAADAPLLLQKPDAEQNPHCLLLRRRPLERRRARVAMPFTSPAAPAPRPTRCSRPTAADRVFRRIRRQCGCLRHARRRRRPQTADLASGARRVLGWTPDGKNIMFSSPRNSYSRFADLFTVPADGGVEEKLPLPDADSGFDVARRAVDRVRADRPGRSRCGSTIGAGTLRPSGSPTSPTQYHSGAARRIPTTLTPCGSATGSTSFPTAMARRHSSTTT